MQRLCRVSCAREPRRRGATRRRARDPLSLRARLYQRPLRTSSRRDGRAHRRRGAAGASLGRERAVARRRGRSTRARPRPRARSAATRGRARGCAPCSPGWRPSSNYTAGLQRCNAAAFRSCSLETALYARAGAVAGPLRRSSPRLRGPVSYGLARRASGRGLRSAERPRNAPPRATAGRWRPARALQAAERYGAPPPGGSARARGAVTVMRTAAGVRPASTP
jgi:hypothetical protein